MGRSGGTGGGQQQPGWPRLSAKHGIRAQHLVGDHLFVAPGVLTVGECQAFIDAAEALGFSHQGSRGAAYGEAFRDNHRIGLEDPGLAAQLWEQCGLRALFEAEGVQVDGERPVGLNPNIRLYRYGPKQKFGKHIDDSVEVAPGQNTRYTLLVYLSGDGGGGGGGGVPVAAAAAAPQQAAAPGRGRPKRAAAAGKQAAAVAAAVAPCTSAVQPLKGGETIFYGDRNRALASVAPRPGMALLHLHGEDRCLEHEGAAVVSGYKYVLRSDVVFGPAA